MSNLHRLFFLSLDLLFRLLFRRRLEDLGQVVSLQVLVVVGDYADTADALPKLSIRDTTKEVQSTYSVDLDQNEDVWVLEIDLMSRANRGRNLLDDIHPLHDGVVADCGTDGELEDSSKFTKITRKQKNSPLLAHAVLCGSEARGPAWLSSPDHLRSPCPSKSSV